MATCGIRSWSTIKWKKITSKFNTKITQWQLKHSYAHMDPKIGLTMNLKSKQIPNVGRIKRTSYDLNELWITRNFQGWLQAQI
jgi:hypothetical protein